MRRRTAGLDGKESLQYERRTDDELTLRKKRVGERDLQKKAARRRWLNRQRQKHATFAVQILENTHMVHDEQGSRQVAASSEDEAHLRKV